MPVYKKGDEKSETKSPLEEVKVFPDHITGRIGEFGVKFTKDDVVAERSYKDVKIRLYGWDDERGNYAKEWREAVVPLVNFSFRFYLVEPYVTIYGELKEGERGVIPTAKFTLDGKEDEYEGAAKKYGGFHGCWFAEFKKMTFDAGFSRRLNRDFELLAKNLSLVIASDPDIQPFKGEMQIKMAEHKKVRELAVRLLDRAEKVAQENDLRKKPEALFPILVEAKKEDALQQMRNEIHRRSVEETNEEDFDLSHPKWKRRYAIDTLIDDFMNEGGK